MKISDQIKHEAETIVNIANLGSMAKSRDIAQLNCCIRRLTELSKYFAIGYDTLATIGEC